MGWNLPDDWGNYMTKCTRCGTRYHASEGCDCIQDLMCQCKSSDWDGDDDNPTCTTCHTGPYQEGRTHRSTHKARVDHGKQIRPGDIYRRTVTFGHYPGGAYTLNIRKVRLKRGLNWLVAEVVES